MVVTDRWQKFTEVAVTPATIAALASHCGEFLVHGVDVEGLRQGIEVRPASASASLSSSDAKLHHDKEEQHDEQHRGAGSGRGWPCGCAQLPAARAIASSPFFACFHASMLPCLFLQDELVSLLGEHSPIPVTYAGA